MYKQDQSKSYEKAKFLFLEWNPVLFIGQPFCWTFATEIVCGKQRTLHVSSI